MAEGDAQNFFQFLKSNVSTDEKTSQLDSLRSFFNKNNIPNEDLPIYIECFKVSLATVNPLILRSAISCYETFLRRLRAQCPSWVKFRVPLLKNLVLEHLASRDLRKRILTILLELWQFNPVEIEKSLHHLLSTSKNAEIRMQTLKWFALAHRSELSFDLKALRPFLVANLEHADPSLREETKELLVLLHKDLSPSTKAHLLRELESHQGLRKDLLQFLSNQLSPQPSDDSASLPHPGSLLSPPSIFPIIASFYPAVELEKVDPLYVNFPKQLEQDVAAMLSSFEGRETEQNWSLRQSNILQIRRYIRGNAPDQYLPELLSVLKSLLRGILVSLLSLRTTLSFSTVQLLKEMAFILKNHMDGFLDALLPNLLKMCSVTKRIVSQAANVAFASILSCCGPLSRTLQFVSLAANDTNAQLRVFASGWISLLLALYPVAKSHIKISANQKLFEKLICIGIADSNSQVRESYRKSFWKYVEYFPNSRDELLKSLEPSSIKQLELVNPNRNQLPPPAFSGPKRAPVRSMTASIRPEAKVQKDDNAYTPPVPQRKLGLPQRMVAPTRERADSQSKSSSTLSTPSSSSIGLNHPPSSVTPQSSKKPSPSNSRENSEANSFEKLKTLQKDYESIRATDSFSPQLFAPYVSFLTQILFHGTSLLYSILYTPALIEVLCHCVDTQSFLSQFILSVYDLSNAGNAFALTSFPYLKSRHPPNEYFFILFDLLMEISSMAPSHKNFPFNTNQKRTVIHGCLLWMKEILEGELQHIRLANSPPSSGFSLEQLEVCASKIIPMITKTRLTSKNWLPLSGLLHAFNCFNPDGFSVLLTRMDKESKTKLLHSWAYQDEFKKNNDNSTLSSSNVLSNQATEEFVKKGDDATSVVPQNITNFPSTEVSEDTSNVKVHGEEYIEKPQDLDMLSNPSINDHSHPDNKNASFTSDLAYDVAHDSPSSSQSGTAEQIEKDNDNKLLSSSQDLPKENQNGITEDKSMEEHIETEADGVQHEQQPFLELSKGNTNTWVYDASEFSPIKDGLPKQQENSSTDLDGIEKTASTQSINVLTDKSNTLNSINVNIAGKGKNEGIRTNNSIIGHPFTKENSGVEQFMNDREMGLSIRQDNHTAPVNSEEELSIISTKVSKYPEKEHRSEGSIKENNDNGDIRESTNQNLRVINVPVEDISLSFSELRVPVSDPTISSPMSDVSRSLTEETIVGDLPPPLSPSVISNSRKESLIEPQNVGKLNFEDLAANATNYIPAVVPQNKWLQNRMKKLEKGSSKIDNMEPKKIQELCVSAIEAFKNGSISSKLIKFCLTVCKEAPNVLMQNRELYSSLLAFIKTENHNVHVSDSLLLLHEYVVQNHRNIEDKQYEDTFSIVLEKGEQCKDDPIIMAAVEDLVTVIASLWKAEKSVIFIHDMLLQRQISEKKVALCLLFFSEFIKRFNDFTHPLMERLIREVVIKYIEHPDAEIRRATFNTCLIVNSIVRSEEKTLSILGDLTEGQKNLLSHVWKMNG
ncbi:CLASP family microtubule-associated protein [Schizosaccharomyces cryophilus OY26]|uniref:CLASP family microtubule-associated protein n=1 Tax=Schizosaccharomyces cryophilus (strain OY26 / ATCC MYA-4695 / CBS 11777 / NBRC 106824 / NRRL Y48691) TaxID=653667 RepID=S9W6D6_SCHCR|nr:CLASP family microtubule-associated protein [Schizosaccharomyces cryophilus OY26]EPY53385.1 CLASP family microtubule-associated protein [Schizosaccharomyces cryophilus OY26]